MSRKGDISTVAKRLVCDFCQEEYLKVGRRSYTCSAACKRDVSRARNTSLEEFTARVDWRDAYSAERARVLPHGCGILRGWERKKQYRRLIYEREGLPLSGGSGDDLSRRLVAEAIARLDAVNFWTRSESYV